jgi:hypothetical protein
MKQSLRNMKSGLNYLALDSAGYQQLLSQAEPQRKRTQPIDSLFEGFVLHRAQDIDEVNHKLDGIFEAGLDIDQTGDSWIANKKAA